jgi:hypothetical protein
MDEQDAGQVAEGLWRALQAADWETAGGYLHDDGVSVLDLQDGKVVKETDYYAQPFKAPAWRAAWTERS